MRWLFLLLLFFNLAYIGWQMNKSSSDEYADVPALKDSPSIVLLSELKQEQPDAAQAAAVEIKTATARNESVVASDLPVKQADTALLKVKPQPVAEVPSEVVAVAEPAEPAEPAAALADAGSAVPAKASAGKLPETASCFTLGPFRDLAKLRSLTREIKSYVVKADFRGRQETEQTLHWVYIKPEKNQKKAVATGKRLKAKKIKDFYVIREGEKINGISLGHFRNKKGAYGLAKKVRGLGFDVIVEPVFKTYTIYWLDYQLAAGVQIPESIFDKHIKSVKKDKISRLSRDCGA